MNDFEGEDYRLTSSHAPAPYNPAQMAPHVPSAAGVVSFMSSNEKQGRWELPRQFRALAVMGNVELDLREAEVAYGLSTIEAVAVMGNIELTIPPHITVECDGDSLLGVFTLKYEGKASPTQALGDRLIKVTGTAYAGAVTIAVKGPDEKMLKKLARTLGMD